MKQIKTIYTAETFESIKTMRKMGYKWARIARKLAIEGVRNNQGKPYSANVINAIYCKHNVDLQETSIKKATEIGRPWSTHDEIMADSLKYRISKPQAAPAITMESLTDVRSILSIATLSDSVKVAALKSLLCAQ